MTISCKLSVLTNQQDNVHMQESKWLTININNFPFSFQFIYESALSCLNKKSDYLWFFQLSLSYIPGQLFCTLHLVVVFINKLLYMYIKRVKGTACKWFMWDMEMWWNRCHMSILDIYELKVYSTFIHHANYILNTK